MFAHLLSMIFLWKFFFLKFLIKTNKQQTLKRYRNANGF